VLVLNRGRGLQHASGQRFERAVRWAYERLQPLRVACAPREPAGLLAHAVGIGAQTTDAVTVRLVGRFNLQFDVRDVRDVRDVHAYAARYAYEDDDVVLAIGRTARKRGYYTRDEFVA
jgi:hypothetical protein